MDVYSIVLFLHIVGAVLLFVLLTVEGVTLRQATTGAAFNRVAGPISALLILIPGFYMVATTWGWKGWVVVGLASWVLIAVVGAITGVSVLRGRMALRTAAISWAARVGLALGVLFLMTAKPDLAGSLVSVVVGTVLGLAAGLAVLGRRQVAG